MTSEFPIIGKKCWSNFCGSYGLPDGLEPHTPLVITQWHEFTGTARDEQGREWSLNRVQIDTGFSIHLDGAWRHESHPLFGAYMRNSLERYKPKADDWTWAEMIENTRWMMERNGFDPDGPIPPCPTLSAPPKITRAPNSRLPVSGAPRRMNS